jgi:tripartite-type tricarboxylate transporter receptor subunit TctC
VFPRKNSEFITPHGFVAAVPLAALAVLYCISASAAAQAYPAKPIRLVIPYPPGGGMDTIGRPLAQRLSENVGQQVVVDNRGGANGTIGMEIVARANPDGHTIGFALSAQLAINPGLYRKLPYDPVKDYAPITLFAEGIYMLIVHPAVPAKSVTELIALARAKPNGLSMASSGNGSGGHLAAALLMSMTGTRMLHVPYKGGGPALVAVLAGEMQALFATYAVSRGHIAAGRVRALGVSTARRPAVIPSIPTIAEAGVPGYDSGAWYAYVAPAKTPRVIVAQLNREIVRALNHPEYRKMLFASAIEPIGSSPDELARYIKSEIVKWAKVIKGAGVRVD